MTLAILNWLQYKNNFNCIHHRTAHFYSTSESIERDGIAYMIFKWRSLRCLLRTCRSTTAFNRAGIDTLLSSYTVDSRLITNRFMTINVSQRIDCLIECDKEPCCRSINIQKKSSSHDAQLICEMLHNLVYNTSEKLLETNTSFDHVYLTSSKKVRFI
jgi:hypothetical protein